MHLFIGIQDIHLDQYKNLLHDGYASTTNFKTVGSYLYQPVTISVNTRELLEVYYNKVRPRGSESTFLFLTFQGEQNKSLGRLLTKYFGDKIGKRITSTSLRSLVATEAANQHKKGHISDEQFNSLHTIAGHSDRIAKEHYIKESVFSNVHHGNTAFQAINTSLAKGMFICICHDRIYLRLYYFANSFGTLLSTRAC